MPSSALQDYGYAVDDDAEPYEFVEIEPAPDGPCYCPAAFREQIMVDVLHDGWLIPERVLAAPRVAELHKSGSLGRHFVRERDWGAELVARSLARALGLPGYHRATLARVVMDFNRFPGSTSHRLALPHRMAISEPMAQALGHADKSYLLEHYYDRMNEELLRAVQGKLLRIAIHSYDPRNASTTQRPEISLLSTSISYQEHSRLPYNLFSPLFPDILAESSAKRILRDRIALTVAKAGLHVAHNYPYCLPEGSVEIRLQPWFYFNHVRQLFETAHPASQDAPAFAMVWRMLLNTNIRDGDSVALMGYLYRFQKAPSGRERDFAAARDAHEEIEAFLRSQPKLTEEYWLSRARTSAIGIEIRKDRIYKYKGNKPVEPREEAAREIAHTLARSVGIFLREDFVEAD